MGGRLPKYLALLHYYYAEYLGRRLLASTLCKATFASYEWTLRCQYVSVIGKTQGFLVGGC